jgi:outer membrane protein assembly factor BamB
MLGKIAAAVALVVSLGAFSISPSLASGKSTVGPGAGWTNTNSSAAQSRANLSETVLTPTAVKKVGYLRSIVAPVIKPSADCPGPIVAPLLTGNYLYAITNDYLSKYDPATGKLLWRVKPALYFIYDYQTLAYSDNLIIVGSYNCESESDPGGFAEAFNASTGALAWRGASGTAAGPAVVVGTSYAVVQDEEAGGYELSVLNLKNGNNIWSKTFYCLYSGSVEPVVVGLVAIANGCDGQNENLEGINLATGAVLWSLPGGWTIQAGDLAGSAGKHVYVTDDASDPSGTVEALNPQTGQSEYSLSAAVDVLTVDASRVYATCGSQSEDTDICAYSISTGGLEWQQSVFTSAISVTLAAEADGVLYLASGQALNASTGQVIKQVWGVGTYNYTAPTAIAVGGGRIAVVGDPRVLDLYGLPGY